MGETRKTDEDLGLFSEVKGRVVVVEKKGCNRDFPSNIYLGHKYTVGVRVRTRKRP